MSDLGVAYLLFLGLNIILDNIAHPNINTIANFRRINKLHLLSGHAVKFHERLFLIAAGPLGTPILFLGCMVIGKKEAKLRELFKYKELEYGPAYELYELTYIIPLSYGRNDV
jgi:hypothetical protein